MGSVVYVHGTGVREPRFSAGLARFEQGLAQVRPDHVVIGCYWGGEHGARLHWDGASIPDGAAAVRSAPQLAASTADDQDIALWAVLDADPLFELDILAHELGAGTAVAPSRTAWPTAARPSAAELGRRLQAHLDAAGLAETFTGAAAQVLSSPQAWATERIEGGAVTPLARAILAQAMRAADELDGPIELDGATRDALLAALIAELGGSERGPGRAVGQLALRVGLALGAGRAVERRRAALTRSSAATAGDVVHYLVRGQAIRAALGACIAAAAPPVTIVAHSLGGVAAVDLCIDDPALPVELLVTVGSQAPLLYELDALPTLTAGQPLPERFPSWINVYDRRDLLAFTAAPIFPGRVSDRHIDNRAPFPRCHSAYFANDAFYALLRGALR